MFFIIADEMLVVAHSARYWRADNNLFVEKVIDASSAKMVQARSTRNAIYFTPRESGSCFIYMKY